MFSFLRRTALIIEVMDSPLGCVIKGGGFVDAAAGEQER